MLKERDCVLPIYSSVTPYASKYAKTSIMTPHDKACLLLRTVTCWCWAKYQMVRWVKCTLLHWWSKQPQSYCIGGPNCTKPLASFSDPPLISQQSKLCIHRQRFQRAHWRWERYVSMIMKNYRAITTTNTLCAVLLRVSLIHVEAHIHYPYGSNKQLFCTSAMATPLLQ